MDFKIHLTNLKDDLIKYTADFVTNSNNHTPNSNKRDFSNSIIIFPTRRIQHFLLHEFATRIQGNFIPPRFFTIDDFFSFLYEEHTPGVRKLTEIEASYYLYGIIEKDFPFLFKFSFGSQVSSTGDEKSAASNESNRPSFSGFFRWALKLLQALETIYSESEEKDIFSAEWLHHNSEIYKQFINAGEYNTEYREFIKSLPDILLKFKTALSMHRVYTRGIAYRAISEHTLSEKLNLPEGRYLFVGFHSPNYCERTLLKGIIGTRETHIILKTDPKSLKEPNSPFYLQHQFIREISKKSNPTYISKENKKEKWDDFSDKISVFSLSDTETEIAKVSEILANTLIEKTTKSKSYKSIVIVLPNSSTLIPLIHGVVARLNNTAFNISLQYPFARTPLYQLIENILRLNINRDDRGFLTRDYLQIVRHPYVKLLDNSQDEYLKQAIHDMENLITEENIVRITTEELTNRFRTFTDSRLAKEKEDKDKEKTLVAEISNIENIHGLFIMPTNLDLEKTLLFLSNAIKKLKTLEVAYPFFGEYLSLFFTAIEEINSLITNHEELNNETNTANITEFILYHLSQQAIPFIGSPLKGIQIMGMLETRGLNFDEVYILDAVEGVLPQNKKYDPLLPYDIRNLFKLTNYTQWEKLFSYNLFSLIGGAKSVYIFNPRKLNGREVPRSRYIEYILYRAEKESEEIKIENVSYKINIKLGSPTRIEKNQFVLNKLNTIVYSPTSITTYLKCPIRFYYSRILRLEEKPEVTDEIDAGTHGLIVHEILKNLFEKIDTGEETYYKFKITDETDKTKQKELIEETLKDAFTKWGIDPYSGINKINLWYIEKQIQAFVENQTKNGKSITIYLEQEFIKKISINQDTIQLSGQIDRVDRTKNNNGETILITDYKTGSAFRSINKKRLIVERTLLEEFIDLFSKDKLTREDIYNEITAKLISFQMLFYTYIFHRAYNKELHSLQGSYLYIGETNSKRIEYKPIFQDPSIDKIKPIFNTFETLIKLILSDILNPNIDFFHTSDTGVCETCPYTYLCKR